LFLGNSYTGVNNLPQMVSQLATSAGDTLVYDSNTPGGYTLQGHSTLAASLAKIRVGTWDVVVLQEQSQIPAFPLAQVERQCFPYSRYLDSVVKAHNPRVRTYFYMTWGRKNGDVSNCAAVPDVCTYRGMDSLLRARYEIMADRTGGAIAPAGAVWRRLRRVNPALELYQSDASHPSVAGTYAAACAFYATLFQKSALRITNNAGLSANDASAIKDAANVVAFDSLVYWRVSSPTAILTNNRVDFILYPNPAGNQVYVEGHSAEFGTLRIIDAQGKVCKEEVFLPAIQKYVFDLSSLQAGMYWVEKRGSGKPPYRQRFIKQ
jgi:hypothetical protein